MDVVVGNGGWHSVVESVRERVCRLTAAALCMARGRCQERQVWRLVGVPRGSQGMEVNGSRSGRVPDYCQISNESYRRTLGFVPIQTHGFQSLHVETTPTDQRSPDISLA
jgi:hypothetical protein